MKTKRLIALAAIGTGLLLGATAGYYLYLQTVSSHYIATAQPKVAKLRATQDKLADQFNLPVFTSTDGNPNEEIIVLESIQKQIDNIKFDRRPTAQAVAGLKPMPLGRFFGPYKKAVTYQANARKYLDESGKMVDEFAALTGYALKADQINTEIQQELVDVSTLPSNLSAEDRVVVLDTLAADFRDCISRQKALRPPAYFTEIYNSQIADEETVVDHTEKISAAIKAQDLKTYLAEGSALVTLMTKRADYSAAIHAMHTASSIQKAIDTTTQAAKNI
jgi:hypothetical protein